MQMINMRSEIAQQNLNKYIWRGLLSRLRLVFVLILLVTASLTHAQLQTPYGEKIGAGVSETIRSKGKAYVVIALREPAEMRESQISMPKLNQQIADLQQGVLSQLSASEYLERHRYKAIPALAGIVTEGGLSKLLADSDVVKVDLDVGGKGSLDVSVPLIGADRQFKQGITGEGIVVAVLDSGLDTDHVDLADDLLYQECFLDFDGSINGTGRCPNGSDRQSGASAAEDGIGHGTHVTGIITSGGAVSSPGVAPNAGIVAIKILDDSAPSGVFAFFSEIVAALDYIIINRQDIDVVNMSITTDAVFSGDCDNSTSYNMAGAAAINTLRASGVVAFASSGNNGSGNLMTSPACLSNVISVGATNNADNVASFTSSNASLDIMAPGVNITSTDLGNGTRTLSGTSMASPHAAGCAALLIESEAALTPDLIETALEASSVKVTDVTNGLTFPRIDCSAILDDYFVRPLGDINGDGSEDVAVLHRDSKAGTVIATVRDAEDDHLIQQISFDPDRTPVAFELMNDIDGNGAVELAVLGQGSVSVEVRDSLSGVLQSTVNFNPNNTPVDLAILPDQDGNAIPELAVLSRSTVDDAVSVVTKDAITKEPLNYVGFNSSFNPLELVQIDDLNGNASVEIAVLGVDGNTAGVDKIEIRDSVTDALINSVYYGAALQVKRVAVLADQNNTETDELAVLRQGAWVEVRINDSLNGEEINTVGYTPGFTLSQVFAIPDLNNNTVPELGVLGVNPVTNQVRVQVRDALSDEKLSDVYFGKDFQPLDDVAVINDINDDGSAELVYLGKRERDGKIRLIIRDSITSVLVNTVDF